MKLSGGEDERLKGAEASRVSIAHLSVSLSVVCRRSLHDHAFAMHKNCESAKSQVPRSRRSERAAGSGCCYIRHSRVRYFYIVCQLFHHLF